MTDLIVRWHYLLNLLQKQSKSLETPPEVLAATRERVRQFAADADHVNFPLPPPEFEDQAFKGMEFHTGKLPKFPEDVPGASNDLPLELLHTASLSAEGIVLPAMRNQAELIRVKMDLQRTYLTLMRAVKQYRRALNTLAKHERRLKVAEKEGRIYRPRRPMGGLYPTRQLPPGKCWCGCGRITKFRINYGNRVTKRPNRFVNGHQKIYLSYMLRIEKGAMKREELPEFLQCRIKWVHCEKCYGWIPNIDPMGRPIERRIGFHCWRYRMNVKWPYNTRELGGCATAG